MPLKSNRTDGRCSHCIHEPCLKRGIDIRNGQGNRRNARDPKSHVGHLVVFYQPDSGALHVLDPANGLLGEHVGKATIGDGERFKSLLGEPGSQFLIQLRAHEIHFVVVAEEEWQAVEFDIRVDVGQRSAGERSPLELTGANLAKHGLVATHHATGIEFQFDPALGPLLDLISGLAHLHQPAAPIRDDGGDFQGASRRRRTRHEGEDGHGQEKATARSRTATHDPTPFRCAGAKKARCCRGELEILIGIGQQGLSPFLGKGVAERITRRCGLGLHHLEEELVVELSIEDEPGVILGKIDFCHQVASV